MSKSRTVKSKSSAWKIPPQGSSRRSFLASTTKAMRILITRGNPQVARDEDMFEMIQKCFVDRELTFVGIGKVY
jgi:hypothetical protein